MARVPVYTAQQGLNVGGSFNAPNRPRRPSVGPTSVPYRKAIDGSGAALSDLGGALSAFGDDLTALAEQRQATADSAWFSKARANTAVDWLEREANLQTGADAGGDGYMGGGPTGSPGPGNGFAGYTESAMVAFEEYRQGVLSSAPSEDAKQMFEQWSDGYGAQVAGRAFEFEQNSLFAQRADDLNSAFDAHVQTVYASPDDYDRVLAQAYDDLAGASEWMTPEQEIDALRKIETSLQLARAKKLATFEPLRFQEEIGLATGPVMGTAAKIIGLKSSGDPNAKNPKSSASGLGQFTNATWIATVRKHRPDLADASDQDLLSLKTDPDFGREMTIRHTEDNINGLIAAGLDPTEGNVYLAHFAGLEGARQVLTADPSASVESILGRGVIEANPFLRGMTGSDLQQWASAKMSGQAPADLGSFVDNPKYSRLSPDQVFALAKDADSAILQQHRSALAERSAVYDAKFNGLMLGIMDGQAGMADIEQARSDGWLYSYEDVAKATKAVEARDRDANNGARALARVADPGVTFNPYEADDRGDIDTAYKEMGGSVGLTEGDKTAVQRTVGLVERSNIVPEPAVTALQAGIRSRDMGEMEKSFTVLDGLRRAYPDATSRAFDASDLARLDVYQGLVDKVPPEELRAWLDPNMDATKRSRLDKLHEEGLRLANDVDTQEILASFDVGVTWGTPKSPFEPQQQLQLRQDFEELVAFRYSHHGDIELAKQQALEALQSQAHWGTSETGSEWRIMKFPPERRYPQINGDHDWMGDKIEDLVRAEVGVRMAGMAHGAISTNAQSWGVIATQETEAAFNVGELPPYAVVYVDEDGAIRTILGDDGEPQLFVFDYEDELKAATDAARAEQGLVEALQEGQVPSRPMDTDQQQQLWGAPPPYTTGGRF